MKHRAILDTIVVLVSCTDSHSKANVNKTLKEALSTTLTIIKAAKQDGVKVRAYASLAFGCPFEGKVPVQQVLDIVATYLENEADQIVLADTLGVAIPEQVSSMIDQIQKNFKIPPNHLGMHMHDSHSRAHENIIEGWKLGVRDFDASVGGCGGCNFAPGSKGNISIEKLTRAIDSIGGLVNININSLREVNESLSKMLNRQLEQ